MIGSFSSITWAVEEPFTEKDYLIATDSYNGHKWYPKKGKSKTPTTEKRKKYLDTIRIREHEWTHYRQHISSHLGIFINQIHNVQEDAVMRYFMGNDELSKEFIVPFLARSNSKKKKVNNESHFYLYVWQTMNLLLGGVDGSTTTIKGVIYSWDLFVQVFSANSKIKYATLDTKLKKSSLSNPKNAPSIYEIIEGFAQYREIHHLFQFNPNKDDFIEILLNSVKGQYSSAIFYIGNQLNIPIAHYLVGILLDLAIQQFEHPMYARNNVLIWEEIHPSFRLERAIAFIKKNFKKLPDFNLNQNNFIECFNIGLYAFGFLDNEAYCSKFQSSFENFDIVGELSVNSKDFTKSNISDSVNKFYNLSINDGIKLRHLYPMIFVNPGFYYDNKNAKMHFKNVTRPPFILDSVGIFIPHDNDRDVWYGYACAVIGATKTILSEIAREGEINKGHIIVKRLLSSYDYFADQVKLKNLLISILGDKFKLLIDKISRLSEFLKELKESQ